VARKARRRVYRRFRPQQNTEDAGEQRRAVEGAARALLANTTPEQLRQEVAEREDMLAEADRIAQLDPNPANLSRYRFASSQVAAARAALQILDRAPVESQ